MKRCRLALALLAIGICAVLLGCSSAYKRKWLTTFFDGVPPEHSGTNIVAVSLGNPATNEVAAESKTAISAAAEANYFAHPPFAEEKCSSCHASQFGQGMKKKTPELCWDCHKNFLAEQKVKHQPVESGDCKSCHDPHQASNKKLLVKMGQALCLECHEPPVSKGKSKHLPAENGECLACH